MDVRQLAALVAIADHGTFSAAARALYTVQSNVSSHVAKLERELNTTLVDRSSGGLTEDGVRVVERARRVLNEIDDIVADVTSDSGPVSGHTRIGVIGTTARWLVPQLLSELSIEHPRVRAIIQEGSTSSLVPNVLSGALNGAIIHLPIDDAELVVEPLFAEDLHLLVGERHPLAEHRSVSLATVAEHPLLLPPPGAPLRKVLDRAATNQGVVLRPQAEIDGLHLVASLVLDGFGAAIVSATAVPTWLHGSFRRIDVTELPRRVVAFIRRRRPGPSAPNRAVLGTLKRIVAAPDPAQPGVHPDLGAIAFPRS
jgi:LysR family hydrogen peroxide-inducible transcriptional activator